MQPPNAPREHLLRSAVYRGEALCTVCLACSRLWWTPTPLPPASYWPRYCTRDWDGLVALPVGVELREDATANGPTATSLKDTDDH